MLSSVAVAKRGYGSMAVSNSTGSQIINILIGLGMPWAIAAIYWGYMATPADLEARDIATRAMAVAADMCVYTNTNFIVEELDEVVPEGDGGGKGEEGV